ncbi:MAG: hypothetical protein WBG30_06345 [Psychrilyobacter sp.]|uniref:DUF7507 domain-containing protein n=1 Tax=Psychrilyobacter sp. TaxID=2586924 RepID=UPI003C77654B
MRKRLILCFLIVISLGIFAVNITGKYSNFLYDGTGKKSGDEILLTNDGVGDAGAAWSKHQFDLSQDFSINFEIYLGTKDAGADGVAFFFKSMKDKDHMLAGGGGNLGYGGSATVRGVYEKVFKDTFGMKFDTYQPAGDQLAFIKGGDVTGFQQKSIYNIEDGKWHKVSIHWNATNAKFSYTFDGKIKDTYSGDITAFLGAKTGYFGFTGASAGLTNIQKVKNIEVTGIIPDSEYKLQVKQSITNGATYSVGKSIEYRAIIRNLGTATINNLNLSSSAGIQYSNWIRTLAPGGSITVNGKKRATKEDVIRGSIIDTLIAKGTLPTGELLKYTDVTRADANLVEFLVSNSVTNVKKGANGELKLEYTFILTNIGYGTLTNPEVKASRFPGGISFNEKTISPGEIVSVKVEYTVTQTDLNAGKIINTATFSIRGPHNKTVEKVDTSTYDLPMVEDFIGSKTVLRGLNFTNIGETIEYEFLIKNIGSRPLSNLTVVDLGISGSINLNRSIIQPGETSKGTGKHKVTQLDLDAGFVESTANFTGTAPGGNLVKKKEKIRVDGTLIDNFEGTKQVLSGENFTAVGNEIKYSFKIKNTGNRTLKNFIVIDPGVSGVISLGSTTLAPGGETSGTGIHTVTQADIDAGEVISTATFTGISLARKSIQKQDSIRVKATAINNFEAKKLIVSGAGFTSVGDEIKYSFEINNTGNTTLSNLVVTDPKILGGITLLPTTISPGAKAVGTGIYRVTQADITTGEVTNTAIFHATTAQGTVVRKQASVSSSGVDFGVLSTNITSDPKIASYGENVTYTVQVRNKGTLDIKNLTVYDNISGIENKKHEKIFTNITTISVQDRNMVDVAYRDGITDNSSNLIITNLAAGETVTIMLGAEIKNASHITLTGGEQVKNQVLVTGKDSVDDGPLYITVPFATLDADQVSITEDGDKIIEPNENGIYTITIENTSDLRAEKISIIDKISEIVNLKGNHVFNRVLTSDIKVIDGVGADVPFTYNSSNEEIIVSEIKAKNKVNVVINAVSKNIKFAEGEVITNKAIVNGSVTLSTLNAAKGILTDLSLKKNVVTTGGDNIAELDDSITYTIEVRNKNPYIAIKDLVMEDSLKTVVNKKGKLALRNINISKIYNKDSLVERNDLKPNNYTGSLSIPVILPNETLVIEIHANLNRNTIFAKNEIIDSVAKISLLRNKNSGVSTGNALGLQDGAPIVVVVPELYIEKTAQKSKISMGEEVIYTIKVSNTSDTAAKEIKIEDEVSQIEGNTIKGIKESVFTNWKWVTESTNFKNKLPGESKDLKIENVTLASKESVTFILTAKTNPNIIDAFFENTASVTEGLTGKVKKSTFKINSANAEIIVTKSANKREARRGEFITYTVRVENPNDVPVKNIKIFDTPPTGFEYMKRSSRFFRTNEKSQEIKAASDKPLIYDELNGIGIDIAAKEVLEITYMFKVGVGVKNGEAENKVVVKSSLNEVISNTGKVKVKIVDDPLFDATTIIGKVFNDRDMDGFQDTAKAEKVLISLEGYEFAATRIIDGISTTDKEKDSIIIESLGEGDEVILIFKPTGGLWETNVITKSGTNITMTDSNKIFIDHSKKKKKGMTGENISLTQKVLKVKGEDYVAVTIVNNGREEKGVPGARLMTIDGLIIETDRYGRFHVPPVKKDRGNSYLIKLDTNSLPMGSTVTTENPKVKRLTRSMTKFNYGVSFTEQRSRLKEKEMVVNIGEVFFIKNKAKFSPGQEINLEILAKKLKKHKKSSIIIQSNTNSGGLKSLGLVRSNLIKKKLTELLGKTASDIEITIERGDKND